MNKITDNENKKQLLEYIKDEKTHNLFLIILSKLRSNNRFCRDKSLIEILFDIFMIILNSSQKNKDYNIAKNCIILSQAFYYIDESNTKEKYIRK